MFKIENKVISLKFREEEYNFIFNESQKYELSVEGYFKMILKNEYDKVINDKSNKNSDVVTNINSFRKLSLADSYIEVINSINSIDYTILTDLKADSNTKRLVSIAHINALITSKEIEEALMEFLI